MSKKRNNPHKPFMVFNTILFFAVLIITSMFLYLAYTYKRDADKKVSYEGRYHIEINNGFAGKSLSVYVNDSLLLNRTMPDTLVQIDINRFAEEHTLMIVDNETDNLTPFNLSKKGSKVSIRLSGDEIVFDETPAAF